jgi:hypothetical protein
MGDREGYVEKALETAALSIRALLGNLERS